MAYYDHAKAAYEMHCKEKYEELKENLEKSNDKNDIMLLKHIIKLEDSADKNKKKIKKYQKFFQTLGGLLPRQSSTRDVIG